MLTLVHKILNLSIFHRSFHHSSTCYGEQKEAVLELYPLPLEGDLLETLYLVLKKNRHPPLAIY
jgi:hypothetical protein